MLIESKTRDLAKCRGLLEVIEEKDVQDVDVAEQMESIRTFTELLENASAKYEEITSSLEKDDERTSKLRGQLQDLKMQIADKKVE